jgi:hypothetical protein
VALEQVAGFALGALMLVSLVFAIMDFLRLLWVESPAAKSAAEEAEEWETERRLFEAQQGKREQPVVEEPAATSRSAQGLATECSVARQVSYPVPAVPAVPAAIAAGRRTKP